jgi:hypothetical protein
MTAFAVINVAVYNKNETKKLDGLWIELRIIERP